MKCPYCKIAFHAVVTTQHLMWNNAPTGIQYNSTQCASCKNYIIFIKGQQYTEWARIVPFGVNRDPVPGEVPEGIGRDYVEACAVLETSAKASSALARRCLQSILRHQGYRGRDLGQEIQLLLDEPDPKKAIPQSLRQTIDGIRNFGNFSAHPITDMTTLQVIEVEPHEAEWCLEIIEEMFQHFYLRPAQAAARKAALDAKLASAGKPPSK